jgi:branched-chain amino acid transport system permease protein
MKEGRFNKFYGYLIILALVFSLPWFFSTVKGGNYYLHLFIMLGLYAIGGVSLNLLIGSTGQISLCHGVFWGLGAYTSAILMMRMGFSFWLTVPIAAIVAGFFGFLIGYPSLRLKGNYFALCTFAFNQLMYLIFSNLRDLTGGQRGLMDIPFIPPLLGLDFRKNFIFAYLVLIFAVITLFIIVSIIRSRIGMAFISIREDEVLAGSTGVNVMKYKVLSFVIATFFAGVAGALYAPYIRYINPGSFDINLSMLMIAMVVVGGIRSIMAGPIIGSAVLLMLPEVLRPIMEYCFLIYGLMVILIIIYAPTGIMGGLRHLIKRFSKEALT